jgi:hypothetical protein
MTGQDIRDRTSGKGQPRQDNLCRTAITDSHDTTGSQQVARTERQGELNVKQFGLDRWADRPTWKEKRTGRPEYDSKDTRARAVYPGLDSQDRTDRQDSRIMTASTVQDNQDKRSGEKSAGTGEP